MTELFVDKDGSELVQFGDNDTKQTTPRKQQNVPNEHPSVRYYEVELPSKGMLGYPEIVEYRDILVRDEKVLSTATEENYTRMLNKVIKSLLKEPEYYDQLSLYDRDFLIMWIWANNYSASKKFEVDCSNCGQTNTVDVDLTKLDVKDLSDDYKNPYPVPLSNGTTIGVRLLTVHDEKIATDFIKKHKNQSYENVLIALSIELDMTMPLSRKIEYIDNNITGKDMSLIRAFHRFFAYGIEDKIEHTCSGCGEVNRFRVPISEDFFMPSLHDDFEQIVRNNRKTGDKSD